MGSTGLKPTWQKADDHIKLTYNIPHQVNDAISYPVLAPNGSSIIIYAHETGLTAVWSGGKGFKAKSNVTNNDSVMVIDSDEEEQNSIAVDFDSSEQEVDFSKPFDQILVQHDLKLETSATKLALVSGLPYDCTAVQSPRIPSLFHSKVVMVVGCSDLSIHLITFDLLPTNRGNLQFEDQIVSSANHKSSLRHLSLTFTSANPASQPIEDSMEEAEGDQAPLDASIWKLIVASHSTDPIPLLSISEVYLSPNGLSIERSQPQGIQQYILKAPLTSLSFNPSRYPSRRHTLLVAADTLGAVRIAELVRRQAGRSMSRKAHHLVQWNLTLHVPYSDARSKYDATHVLPRRQTILDAQWVLHGKCIVVLLDDGNWGLWDLDAAGPYSRNSSASSISGSSTTKFALKGRLKSKHRSAASLQIEANIPQDRKLAPMTPNTRKAKQTSLFSSAAPASMSTSTVHSGGIASSESSLLVHFDDVVYLEPDLMTYWQRLAARADDSGEPTTLLGPDLSSIPYLMTGGQTITHIGPLTSTHIPPTSEDIFLATSHSVHLRCRLKTPPTAPNASILDPVDNPDLANQDLLARNELDLEGIDQALDSMQDRSNIITSTENLHAYPALFEGAKPTRRVEFAAR